MLVVDPQWNRLDRAQIDRDVLAARAVASRGATHEDSVLVDERDRGAVDLGLQHVRDRLVRVEALAHVLGPLRHGLLSRDLLERAHRGEMLDLAELLRRRRADALSGRVGRDQFGVGSLELDELVVERVVDDVLDLLLLEDVIGVCVASQQLAQLADARLRRGRQAAPPPCRQSRRGARARDARGRGSCPR